MQRELTSLSGVKSVRQNKGLSDSQKAEVYFWGYGKADTHLALFFISEPTVLLCPIHEGSSS